MNASLKTIIIYIDMDHVLCDYEQGFKAHKTKYPDLLFPQSRPGLYINLLPIAGAIETFKWLSEQANFSVYILTAPSIKNPHSYSEKREWVEKHLGMLAVNNLIISAHKGLHKGNYLIDDCTSGKGQENFEGQLIQLGSVSYPDWNSISKYFEKLA
jgi:5'-nucleotidase